MNVGFGTASFGTTYSKADSFAVLDKYVELGGRMIDTANNYAFWVEGGGLGGQAETVLGEWFASNPREQFHLTTKIGARPAPEGSGRRFDGLGRDTVFTAVDECLERLQTDHLDSLLAHFDDPHTPLKETWETFNELVKKGVVKKLGVSNYSFERLQSLIKIIAENNYAPISTIQFRHTVIPPAPQADFGIQVPLTSEIEQLVRTANPDVVIEAFSPLLDGGFEVGRSLPESDYLCDENVAAVTAIQQEAAERGVSPSALVLWRLNKQGYRPLTMTSKVERVESNLALFLQ